MSTTSILTTRIRRTTWSDRRIVLAVLILIVGAVMSMLSPYFLRAENLLSMTQFGAVVGLLALGQAMVILAGAGGIDLSVGSMMSLTGVLMGLTAQNLGWSPWLAALVAIASGLALGALNGFLVTIVGIPALISTLGTLFLFGSMAQAITGGGQTGGLDRDGFRFLGNSAILGIPTQVLLVLIPCYLIVGAIFAWTKYGRRIYQTGNNEQAARLVGINVTRIRFSLYCWSGVLSAIAAIVSNSWLLTARPAAGLNLDLQAVTIAVLGGIFIFGGRGSLGGVALAVLLVIVLNSGLQLADVSQTVQAGVLGALLVISALLAAFSGFRPSRRQRKEEASAVTQ
jgi:ribose/xylose/arabinose/galactoside ABC-type transport system permease subunit